jgi:hypothetical protein
MVWHLGFTTSVTRIRLRASARRPSWPLGDVARALVGGFEQAAISGSYSKASALRFQFRRRRLRGQKMRAWASGGKCSSVVTVFRSLRHSVVRARDLRDRGEIFVGGDEQAIGLRKLAAFGLVACGASIGIHLPNLFCEFRQGYATTLLSLVKRFVMADFLYTAKGRAVFPESSTQTSGCSHRMQAPKHHRWYRS